MQIDLCPPCCRACRFTFWLLLLFPCLLLLLWEILAKPALEFLLHLVNCATFLNLILHTFQKSMHKGNTNTGETRINFISQMVKNAASGKHIFSKALNWFNRLEFFNQYPPMEYLIESFDILFPFSFCDTSCIFKFLQIFHSLIDFLRIEKKLNFHSEMNNFARRMFFKGFRHQCTFYMCSLSTVANE